MHNRTKSRTQHQAFSETHGPFHIDCKLAIFNQEEIDIPKKYGHWFKALTSGNLLPITPLKERFIEVMKGNIDKFSIEETALSLFNTVVQH